MTPEWIRLTRPSGKPRHLHVSHLVSVSPSTGGSEIEMTGHEYNVLETDEEIMALLGVDARPKVQPDKQPARTTIIIGRETLESLANRQAVVVGNVTIIDGDNFPRGLFSSPATPSEEPQPTGAAPELGALQEAQNERVRGESPVAGADPPWLDEAAKLASNVYYGFTTGRCEGWATVVRAVLAYAAAQPPSEAEIDAALSAYPWLARQTVHAMLIAAAKARVSP